MPPENIPSKRDLQLLEVVLQAKKFKCYLKKKDEAFKFVMEKF